VGNYIQQKPLQGQCCNILSKLLAAFDGNTSAETLQVLGRQLQVDFTNTNPKKQLFNELLFAQHLQLNCHR
jgi:hypothetical protein